MPSPPLALRDSIDQSALRPVVYQGLVLVLILTVIGLGIMLPGVDRTVPETAITIRELVVATGTAAVVLWLAQAAPDVAELTRESLDGPDQLVTDAGRVAGALIAFLAVLVAYRGFIGIAVPTFVSPSATWAYDLAFFAVGLGPLAVIANRLRRNLDVAAELVTVAVVGSDDRSVGSNESTEGG